MPHFSVIIVSYESADWLPNCLAAIEAQDYQDFEVIVIDNASKDRSVELANVANLPHLRVVKNETNMGFAAGSNQGAKMANGLWLVFLNPDTVPHTDWLAEIAKGQSRLPDISVFACAQYALGDRTMLDGAGDAYFGFGIPWRGGFGHPASSLPAEGECFSPCGAAAVFRKDKFFLAGGFDERFFCYCEDVDLGFRLRLMGERCMFLNKAAVDHQGSAITGRHSDFTVYYGTRNRLWTYFKNMPLGLLILTLPGHIAISIYLLYRAHSIGRFGAAWRGLRDGIGELFGILSSRGRYPKPDRLIHIRQAMTWNFNSFRKRRPCVRVLNKE